jgi:hypothetical protein
MARVLGLGTLVKVDDDDSGATYTTLVLMTDVTPPPRRRVRVDATALEDTLATDGAGIEDKSDFKFLHFYDPGATNDTIVATLFAAKTQVLWQILYADSGTETFEGIVMEISPQTITGDKYLMREVTVHRVTASTFA